ncbi:MAG TPA: hypothetical protein VFR86_10585, partial [Burkholderiaceae bacterium]|nr:hypothetical protein [Burkholderiaceae bacterium]
TLLQHARGVVVVNSTTGLQAMHHGTAVHVCGRSFYAKPGLVSPGSLDEFWVQPIPPLPELFTQFLRVINHYSQVNASFYVDGGLSDFRRHPPVLRPMSERVVRAANDEDFSERRPQPYRHEVRTDVARRDEAVDAGAVVYAGNE